MKKIIIGSIASLSIFVPTVVAYASVYDFPSTGNLTSLITWGTAWLNVAMTLIVSLAVIYFLYGVFKTIKDSDNEDRRKEGKDIMIYGIIGLAVMFSFWGLVLFVQRSFGFSTGNVGPQFQTTK